MKMKKYFKFLTVAAIIAAGMIGCSSEAPVDKDGDDKLTPPIEQKASTYATFRFVDASATRATNLGGDASETPPSFATYRLLVFDGVGTAAPKEVDSVFNTSGDMTVRLQSGDKQIFVIQNSLGTASNWSAGTAGTRWFLGVSSQSATAGALFPPANMSEFSVSSATSTAPLIHPNIDNLSDLYNASAFILSNRSDSATFTLKPGITGPESQTPGNDNYVKLNLRRVIAKVFISQVPNSPLTSVVPHGPSETITLDSAGIITTTTAPTYRMLNILTQVYPIQYFSGPSLQTPHMNDVFPAYEAFVARGYRLASTSIPTVGAAGAFFPLDDTVGIGTTATATGGDIPVVVSASPTGTYYYVTENVALEMRMATFAAIKAQFTPTKNHYITSVAYNNTNNTFTPAIGATNAATGTFFYLKKLPASPNFTGVPVGTIVAGASALDVARKIVYHFMNPTAAEKGSYTTGDASDTDVAAYFSEYNNGYCYYRLDMGSYKIGYDGKPVGAMSYGLIRNHSYHMSIDGFFRLGANRVADLIGPPGSKLKGETYLTVSVVVVPWEPVSSGTPV
jgi:hypothetical protein